MAKEKFYKLNKQASMFYDPKSKLKITNGIPAKLSNTAGMPKAVVNAVRNGHIIEISETEYDAMINKLPEATRNAAKLDQKALEPKKVVKEDEEEDEEDDDNGKSEDRLALEERLEKLGLSNKEKKKKLKLDDEALEEYLISAE